MKLLRFLILYVIIIYSLPSYANDLAPYIYYYSHIENAFVVERADGTEARLLVSPILEDTPVSINGSGWSPDGSLFVFSVSPPSFPNGHIININSSTTHTIPMWNISQMHWSPDGNYLLVSGNIDDCTGYCSQETNWLIDTGNGQILAWLDIRLGFQSPGSTPVTWTTQTVSFYRFEENFPNSSLSNYYQITMSKMGEVTKKPITKDDYLAKFVSIEEESVTIFESPSDRYTISSTGQLTDTKGQHSVQLPMPSFGFDGTSQIYNVQWNSSEDWAFISYNVWSGGVDGISIVKGDGSEYRVLTTCGSSLSCVSWLPDSVEVGSLDFPQPNK